MPALCLILILVKGHGKLNTYRNQFIIILHSICISVAAVGESMTFEVMDSILGTWPSVTPLNYVDTADLVMFPMIEQGN